MHIWGKGRAAGSGQTFVGLGRNGSKKSDPWTTLIHNDTTSDVHVMALSISLLAVDQQVKHMYYFEIHSCIVCSLDKLTYVYILWKNHSWINYCRPIYWRVSNEYSVIHETTHRNTESTTTRTYYSRINSNDNSTISCWMSAIFGIRCRHYLTFALPKPFTRRRLPKGKYLPRMKEMMYRML